VVTCKIKHIYFKVILFHNVTTAYVDNVRAKNAKLNNTAPDRRLENAAPDLNVGNCARSSSHNLKIPFLCIFRSRIFNYPALQIGCILFIYEVSSAQ